MRRMLVAGALIAVVGALVPAAGAVTAPKTGKACSKAGLTATIAGKAIVCTKSGKLLRWLPAKAAAKPAATVASSARPQTTNVTVSATEMSFALSTTTVPHGTVVFTVKNSGALNHDFSFGSAGGGTPMLKPGESATITVQFPKPGKYTFICTVEGHQEAGMIGALNVT